MACAIIYTMSINGAKSQSKVGMKDCAGNFTPERTEELRKKVDFSDIPEIKDLSTGHLRNCKPIKKPITVRIDI